VELERITARLRRAIALASMHPNPSKDEEPWMVYLAGHFLIAVDRAKDAEASAREDLAAEWTKAFFGKVRKHAIELCADRQTTYKGFVLELFQGVAKRQAPGAVALVPTTGYRVLRAN
jgi:hypothetical protein